MADLGTDTFDLILDPSPGPTVALDTPAPPDLLFLPVTGPAGPVGPVGGGNFKLHTQTTPAASWAISHTFGRYPDVQLLDTTGRVMDSDIEMPNTSTVVVTFANPTAGFAVLT